MSAEGTGTVSTALRTGCGQRLLDEPIGAVEFNRLAGRYGVQVVNAGQVDGWPTWQTTCRWPGCGWTGNVVGVFGAAAAQAAGHCHLPAQRVGS